MACTCRPGRARYWARHTTGSLNAADEACVHTNCSPPAATPRDPHPKSPFRASHGRGFSQPTPRFTNIPRGARSAGPAPAPPLPPPPAAPAPAGKNARYPPARSPAAPSAGAAPRVDHHPTCTRRRCIAPARHSPVAAWPGGCAADRPAHRNGQARRLHMGKPGGFTWASPAAPHGQARRLHIASPAAPHGKPGGLPYRATRAG